MMRLAAERPAVKLQLGLASVIARHTVELPDLGLAAKYAHHAGGTRVIVQRHVTALLDVEDAAVQAGLPGQSLPQPEVIARLP